MLWRLTPRFLATTTQLLSSLQETTLHSERKEHLQLTGGKSAGTSAFKIEAETQQQVCQALPALCATSLVTADGRALSVCVAVLVWLGLQIPRLLSLPEWRRQEGHEKEM